MSEQVMACIDGSGYAPAVCDYAVWASQRLAAPLVFMHVLDNHPPPQAGDLSGNIGLGSREHLLDELAQLDERRAKVAQQQGRLMLDEARQRAQQEGAKQDAGGGLVKRAGIGLGRHRLSRGGGIGTHGFRKPIYTATDSQASRQVADRVGMPRVLNSISNSVRKANSAADDSSRANPP